MKTINILSAALLGTVVSGAAQAQDLYGMAMIGGSAQINDNAPYGNNVAVDPDFPAAFSNDTGQVGALGVGYAYSSNFRVEARLSFRHNDFNDEQIGTGARDGEQYILDGSAKSTALTVEAFYDIDTASALRPYVKAGLGASRNKYKARLGGAGVAAFDAFDGTEDGFYDAYADGSSTDLTWNVGVGASYELANGMTLFGEYQYVSVGDIETGQDGFTDGFGLDSELHEVSIGIRTSF